jgi:predicted dehydrogenase
VRRLVSDGTFGDLREVHVTSLNGNATNVSAPLHWRERREYSGVNAMNLGMLNEVVQRWLGPTERVVADAATYIARRDDPESGEPTRIEVPDSLGVLARMVNGARATYRLGTTLHASNAMNGISIYGSAATLHWSIDDKMTFARAGEPLQPLAPDAGTAGSWRVEADFVDSIRTGAPVELTSFADGLDYMRFTEAVARSAAEGRAIDLASL